MYDPQPYTAALQTLQDKYGQPRQLVQSELGAILNSPAIKSGDAEAFDSFALSVQSLVGMLRILEGQGGSELRCGSHIDRLLSKMQPAHRDSFVESCLGRGMDQTYTFPDLAAWLQMEAQAKRLASKATAIYESEASKSSKKDLGTTCHKEKTTAVLLNTTKDAGLLALSRSKPIPKPYCPHCGTKEHFLNSCPEFQKFTTNQVIKWIQDGQ